jgi:uncharacterized protein
MRILAISDNVLPQLESTENLRHNYSDVEVVISCGDMPPQYLDVITSTLNVPLLFVRGNHDTNYEPGFPGGEDLHGKIINYHGMTFAGLEGSPRYNREPVQYTETQMWMMILRMAPRLLWRRMRYGCAVDVMVTHASPRDIHDMQDKPHRGFKSFRFLISFFRPRYFIHGHVDTWDNRRPTVTRFAETEVININPVKALTLERRR